MSVELRKCNYPDWRCLGNDFYPEGGIGVSLTCDPLPERKLLLDGIESNKCRLLIFLSDRSMNKAGKKQRLTNVSTCHRRKRSPELNILAGRSRFI